jgi:hypothetical protein
MIFLIDGYNVTRRDAATEGLSIAEQRDALVRRLRARGGSLLGTGRIVVVFDGEGGAGVSSMSGSPVDIVFARGGSADDEIVRIVRNSAEKVVLVSADRDLARRASVHAPCGLEVRDPSSCFEGAGSAKSRRTTRGALAREAGQPRNAQAITRELKELWLSEEDM